MGKKAVVEEAPMGAPLYMVSFGDMITILLTFFILLCSYAEEQQSGFVSDGVGSFRAAVNDFGLPGALPGDTLPVDLGARRVRFKPVGALNPRLLTEPDGSISDLNRDALRQVVKKALRQDKVTRIPAEMVFEPGSWSLTPAHRSALDVIAPLLVGKNMKIRIEGYAYEEGIDDDLRRVAARRAEAVARYLVEEQGVDEKQIETVGYGSSGPGAESHRNRIIQDLLGRRIAYISLVPAPR